MWPPAGRGAEKATVVPINPLAIAKNQMRFFMMNTSGPHCPALDVGKNS
jgi:hypothetical protein